MSKDIVVTDGSNREEIKKLNDEIRDLNNRMQKLEEKRNALVKKELEDKIIVTPVVVVERTCTFPSNFWGFEVWF